MISGRKREFDVWSASEERCENDPSERGELLLISVQDCLASLRPLLSQWQSCNLGKGSRQSSRTVPERNSHGTGFPEDQQHLVLECKDFICVECEMRRAPFVELLRRVCRFLSCLRTCYIWRQFERIELSMFCCILCFHLNFMHSTQSYEVFSREKMT